MKAKEIIITGLLTEKSQRLAETGKYQFRVNARANKISVMQAVRELFKVTPVACNIINVHGKKRRLRNRQGKTSQWKKAIVTLKKGESMDLFKGENV